MISHSPAARHSPPVSMKNALLATLLLSALTLLPGCLGPFNASRTVLNWNANLHEEDAVCEVVFIGLNIIPVYAIVGLADLIVLNTIDYWSGENPVDDPGPFPGDSFRNDDASEPGEDAGEEESEPAEE